MQSGALEFFCRQSDVTHKEYILPLCCFCLLGLSKPLNKKKEVGLSFSPDAGSRITAQTSQHP
jgi:hypothetical protein